MTMRVTVTNHDSSRTAVVHALEVKPEGPHPTSAERELAPGESADFWIHDTRYLHVREKP